MGLTYMRAICAHCCFCQFRDQQTANVRVGLGAGLRFRENTGQGMQQVGTADDSRRLLAANHGNALDTTCFSIRSTTCSTEVSSLTVNRVACHNILDFAAMRVRVFSRQLTGSDQEFKPSRPSLLRSGFDASKKITFGNHSDEAAVLVDHRQSADMLSAT